MNHTYRVVYRPASNTYVAVSEMTTHKTKSSKVMVASAAVAALGLTQQAQAVVTVSDNTHSSGVITGGVSATYMDVVAVPSLSVKQRIAAHQPKSINFATLQVATAAESAPSVPSSVASKPVEQVDEEVISTVRVTVPANDDVHVKTTAATAAADNLPKEPTASKRVGHGSGSLIDETLTHAATSEHQSLTVATRNDTTGRSLRASLAKTALAGPTAHTTTGVNVNVNGENVAVEAGSTFNLINGQGTVVHVDNTQDAPTVKINTPLSYANQSGQASDAPTNAVAMVGADATKPVTIHNVEAGVATNDAVNVGQLRQVNQHLTQKIEEVADDAKAGTAAALAAAGLAQAYIPGKSMVSIAGSTYRGKQGYAVGFSTITDSGNWVFKGAATGHSQGHFGATIGAGYQW